MKAPVAGLPPKCKYEGILHRVRSDSVRFSFETKQRQIRDDARDLSDSLRPSALHCEDFRNSIATGRGWHTCIVMRDKDKRVYRRGVLRRRHCNNT
jgi:hypothetical protein